ncbi:MAG: hypothetical protein ACOY99_06610 [Pseudomonadota bacterium]
MLNTPARRVNVASAPLSRAANARCDRRRRRVARFRARFAV